jgi:DNA-binding transcriptional regulator GbsR (MarR family)
MYTLLLQDELCDRELAELLDLSVDKVNEHLDELKNMDLIENEIIDGCEIYQARSNPFEEARQKVLEGESHEWNDLHNKICEVKQKQLCSYRKNRISSKQETMAVT